MRKKLRFTLALVAVFPLLLARSARAGDAKQEFGVYEYVVQPVRGSFEEAAAALEAGVAASGWRLLAKVDAGVPEGCPYKARVFALADPEYAAKLLAANRRTGPFAAVDRVNVFEDEKGVHAAVLNEESINRTVLMDDQKYRVLTHEHFESLRKLVADAIPGTVTDREYGEKRSEGYIGKTMGVMAGGPFAGKVKDEAVVAGGDWRAVAGKVREGLVRPGGKWGMHLVYELELPEYETMVFGSTGTPMDSKSFSIVGAGADDARDAFKCPGIAHAAAYPVEVVITREGETVRVRLVDVMYRMKMYFEDAGKWAFMKNMGMPGSIHDELADQIRTALARP